MRYFFGGFFFFLSVQYSALLHLPPLRFHCADGCWDRNQDRCNGCRTIATEPRTVATEPRTVATKPRTVATEPRTVA